MIEEPMNFFVTIYDPEMNFTITSDEQESKSLYAWEIALGGDNKATFQMQDDFDNQVFIPAEIFNRSIRYITFITPEVRERLDNEKKRRERTRYI